jgi:choline-sulfatase
MKKPNIILIMSDQHTPSVLGCYGNEVVKTPNLDQFAANGVLFENAYCNNPVCVPSRMSMLTGLHSHDINVWCNADALPPQVATWPLVLQTAGYETVISGRNHLLWGNRMGGFSSRLCGDESTSIPYIKDGRTQLGGCGPQGIDSCLGSNDDSGYAKHDETANLHAIEYLKNHRDDDSPFALFIGYYQPHAPFVAKSEYYDMYRDSDLTFDIEHLHEAYLPLLHTLQLDREIDPVKLSTAIKAYYGMVSHIDSLFGEILTTLEECGLAENSIVIYTSDHGEMLGQHRLWHKMCFYEDSVRVPFIVHHPQGFSKGQRVSANISLLDLFPTFLDWAGIDASLPLAGDSLQPLMEEGIPLRDRPVIAESIGVERGHPGRMVKYGNLKLIHYYQRPPMLFDLENDPHEQLDVSEDPGYADSLNSMLQMAAENWKPEDINRTFDWNMNHLKYHNQVST